MISTSLEMGIPHALVLPYPSQGHVIPLMELSYRLVECGFKITFVNTEFNHDRVLAALAEDDNGNHRIGDDIRLIAVPDGLESGDDRNDLDKLCDSLLRTMPGKIEEIVRKSEEDGETKITCVIADQNMALVMPVARKLGIRSAAFWPAATALLVIMLNLQRLIEDGIIDEDGNPKKHGKFQLGPDMPLVDTSHLSWICFPDSTNKMNIFRYIYNNSQATELAEFIVCNSFYELEQPTFAFAPNVMPIGPIRSERTLRRPVGHFWAEDHACIDWLDKQEPNSVVYAAFGSYTMFTNDQFQELALGLELSGRPFLWVVRPNITDPASTYPDGYENRVSGRGKIVSWSPQEKVLAHPSVACFLSHCGWNSTVESVTNGVPFLCWPYFCDQFMNETYICDTWKNGLRLPRDENGIISREKIRSSIEELLADQEIKGRAVMLKEKAKQSLSTEGSSSKNLSSFIAAMKQ